MAKSFCGTIKVGAKTNAEHSFNYFKMPTHNEVDYVLVSDVSSDGQLSYYTGYFKLVKKRFSMPVNSSKYTEALKIAYKNEAQTLCDNINKQKCGFSYHVEEHAYFETPE